MNGRASLAQRLARISLRSFALAVVLLFGVLGCMTPNQNEKRAQSDEDPDKDRYEVKTIGDISTVTNADNLLIAGIGLVVGLENTGGESLDEELERQFTEYLNKKGIRNVKELLHSPTTALVQVTGLLPTGARRGESFDVDLLLPPHSKATSLRGGYLEECCLYNYEMASNLAINEKHKGVQGALQGVLLGKAKGPVLVGLGDEDDQDRSKAGRIWGGGKAVVDRNLMLLLNADYKLGITSHQIATRINDLFQGGIRGTAEPVAQPDQNHGVLVRVPPQYKLNVPRFLRVVRLIPFQAMKQADYKAMAKAAAKAARDKNPTAAPPPPPPVVKTEPTGRPYRQRLADDLLDPARTVTATLRLEALGPTSIPLLLQGLKNKDSLVRFCAAEALAYLGSPSAADELAVALTREPMLRAFGLTALASLDESVARVKLQELLTNGTEPETRYGAFRALRALDETDSMVQGEMLNEAFYLHQVARDSRPMVHVSTARRAEVVVFGPEPQLLPPFSFLAGDFVLTATADDNRCTVSRIPPGGAETQRRQCPLALTEVLHTMAKMGAEYAEVVTFLKSAQTHERLTSMVCLDALPQATTVFDLASVGQSGVPLDAGGDRAVPDLGATPTLYEKARAPRNASWDEDGRVRMTRGDE